MLLKHDLTLWAAFEGNERLPEKIYMHLLLDFHIECTVLFYTA